MQMIPREDDKPDAPPVLSLSTMVPDNFQHDNEHVSEDTATTSDELLEEVAKITKKKPKESGRPKSAKQN